MIETKQAIIMSEGEPVTVTAVDGTITDTTALIGQGNRGATASAVTLESDRKGQFLPSVTVGGGSLVAVPNLGETCLVVSHMKETIQGKLATKVCFMFVCNSKVTVSGIMETADNNGNRVKAPNVKAQDLPAYTLNLASSLEQFDAGLFPTGNYRVYVPSSVDVTLLDSVKVNVNGKVTSLKVMDADNITFDGVTIIHAQVETRK